MDCRGWQHDDSGSFPVASVRLLYGISKPLTEFDDLYDRRRPSRADNDIVAALARTISQCHRSRGEPSEAKAMGLCLGVACKLSFWSEHLGRMRGPSRAPKRTLKLFVSVPSHLQALPSIDAVS